MTCFKNNVILRKKKCAERLPQGTTTAVDVKQVFACNEVSVAAIHRRS